VPPDLDLSVDRGARMPLGAQLADRIRAAAGDGTLTAGDRLPSVRELARIAGVNVNTARAVYARLESEEMVSSEQGRGTFVARRASAGGPSRRELRDQIAALEATLSRLPPPPLAENPSRKPSETGASLPSTDELVAIRDHLLDRLQALDTERSAVLESLERLGLEAAPALLEQAPSRRATPSLTGARIRWVGA
jgi:DNA-binding transcriptional regulator YhcF (GntR family)